MKKLLFMFAAVAALTFASCDTTSTNEGNENADSTAFSIENFTEQLGNAQDSAAVVGLMDQANTEINALFEKGDTAAAQILIEKIKEVIETNKEKLAAIAPSFATLATDVIKLPEGLKEAAAALGDSAKAELADKANEVVDAAKAAAEEKANEVVDKAAEKANEAVDKAKDKAAEAANEALKKLGK